MQRRLGNVMGYGWARAALLSHSCCSATAASLPLRRFQSTATDVTMSANQTATARPADAAATPPAQAAAAAGETPAHIRQLYKSSHKGRGTTPMPKPYQERKLRARRAPADAATAAAVPASAEPAAAAAPAPLFGARSSCAEDAGPVPQRPLSPLQKRQLQFRSKAAFVLTPQALRRIKYLLAQFAMNHPTAEPEAPSTVTAAGSSSASGAVSGAKEVPCGIRIGVRRRGCSGYSYTVNYYFESAKAGAKAAATATSRKLAGLMEDVVVEQEGVKVVVDADALFYVIGTEMDYVVRNVEEKFTFKNPNQKYGCGCEESFMPYDADDMDDD